MDGKMKNNVFRWVTERNNEKKYVGEKYLMK